MLDIKRIRERTEEVRQGLRNRNADDSVVDKILDLDGKRRNLIKNVEDQKSKRNSVSKQIGALRKTGEDTTAIQNEMRLLGEEIADLDKQIADVEVEQNEIVLRIPNIPSPTTPIGKSSEDNVVVRTWGKARTFNFEPKGHIEIGEKLGIFDFARSAKLSGTGFPLLIGQGAKLQRALICYMLDMHTTKHGYTELRTPYLVTRNTMTGTGQLPKLAEDMYHCEVDDLWLIPTAEVPVTNFFANEIIDDPLPIYLTAHTPCFRREAGAAGRDNRGIIRVHQFDKVEMVKFVEPSTSYDELESLVANAENILRSLEQHYRILALCSGDMGFSAAKCYDIELWTPGQHDWLEVSSCSNFEDFQARRAGIKFRDAEGKAKLVHTLNGSGVALPRLVVSILENGQQEDGSVILPSALVPYMGGQTVLMPVK